MNYKAQLESLIEKNNGLILTKDAQLQKYIFP